MPLTDETGILIKDPWGSCPVVTLGIPGVSIESLARASLAWIKTSRRPAVTLSANGTMVQVESGMSIPDICSAFSNARKAHQEPRQPAERNTAPLDTRESPDFWNIRTFVENRSY